MFAGLETRIVRQDGEVNSRQRTREGARDRGGVATTHEQKDGEGASGADGIERLTKSTTRRVRRHGKTCIEVGGELR